MNFKQKSVIFIATGCYIGNITFAPGTFGTALGLLLCFFLSKIDYSMAVLLTLIFILCAIWIANEAEKILKIKDPGCIVIDEIAGIILTLSGLPFNITSVTAGFLVFRALDIWKPYPIRLLENKFSGGIGIVLDDVAAGILSNLILRFLLKMIY
jgi:phosphatidylglycerophosphatase A